MISKLYILLFVDVSNSTIMKQSVVMPIMWLGLRSGPCRVWNDESMQKVTAGVEQDGDMLQSRAVWYITFNSS